MNPCLRCGKRREHAFHDPRARVYAEDRHEYEGERITCSCCGVEVHSALTFGRDPWAVCPPCYDALEAVTA